MLIIFNNRIQNETQRLINQFLSKVVELFEDPKNLKEYQDGFIRKVPVSEKQGEVGSRF